MIFKGYIPTFGSNNKLYTFKYDGNIVYTDASMAPDVKRDFEEQLSADFGFGFVYDLEEVKAPLKRKSQYRMQM